MTDEQICAVKTVNASAEVIFRILADPSTHEAIDGTGWVRESLDGKQLTEVGQIFRIAMYHDNHPDKHYEMANLVRDFERPHVVSWEPGQRLGPDGELQFGGWIWRYDLTPDGPNATRVKLSYDWSAVAPELREHIGFPPFPHQHLDNSLDHLDELAQKKIS